jgi:hypothetical protein
VSLTEHGTCDGGNSKTIRLGPKCLFVDLEESNIIDLAPFRADENTIVPNHPNPALIHLSPSYLTFSGKGVRILQVRVRKEPDDAYHIKGPGYDTD